RRPLRLDRRHRHDGSRGAVDRNGGRPADPGDDDRPDVDAAHARGLAVRVRRVVTARRTLFVAVLALAVPGVAGGAAGDRHHSQVARTPALSANFSYVETGGQLPHHYKDGRVTIVRADGRRFAFSLRPLRPGYDVAPIFAGPDGKAIHIRHLDDKRGDPEVVVDLYWGGAHCCFYTVVFRYDPAARTYVRASHLWGDTSPRVRELGSDGRLEFVSGAERSA